MKIKKLKQKKHIYVDVFFCLLNIVMCNIITKLLEFLPKFSYIIYVMRIVSSSYPLSDRLNVVMSSILAVVILMVFISLKFSLQTEVILFVGLFIFGSVFAVNSALHSYLIVALAKEDGVSMDVGFYYTANALGRLLGTVLSGVLYQGYATDEQGLLACLLASFVLALASAFFIKRV